MAEHSTLRDHKIIAQCFTTSGEIGKTVTLQVMPGEITSFTDFDDVENPAAILLNVEDHGYCKVVFGEKSLPWFKENLSRVESPLSR
jgi:hypothetical protein